MHKTIIYIIQLYFIIELLRLESFVGQLAVLFTVAMSQNVMLSGSIHILYSKSTGSYQIHIINIICIYNTRMIKN